MTTDQQLAAKDAIIAEFVRALEGIDEDTGSRWLSVETNASLESALKRAKGEQIESDLEQARRERKGGGAVE